MRTDDYIVYVIDPDETVHDALAALLSASGRKVQYYPNAEAFLNVANAQKNHCGCVLAEASLPGMGSLALLRQLRVRGVKLPVAVLTSTSNRYIAEQALKAGAVEVIEKPLVGDRLLRLLQSLAAEENTTQLTDQ